MATPRSGRSYQVQSVDYAVRLLQLLRDAPEIRVTDAAAQLGVAPSTAHRLLSTLAAHKFVIQDRVSKAYRVGPGLIELGVRSTTSFDLRAVSEPHLRTLAETLGETVNLVVLEGPYIRFVAGFESPRHMRTHVLTGTLLPAYATSGGKILLADLPHETLRELYPGSLRKLTPKTQTFTQLVHELSTVMMRGFAENRGESVEGLSAIAVPVREPFGRTIAAVAMSAPTGRYDAMDLREVVITLRGCAAAIRGQLSRRP